MRWALPRAAQKDGPPAARADASAAQAGPVGSSPASATAAVAPESQNQHVIFGRIETLMNSSSGSASSSYGPSSEDRSRRCGPGKKDLAKLLKWRINPATIEFSQVDLTSSSSSAAHTPTSKNSDAKGNRLKSAVQLTLDEDEASPKAQQDVPRPACEHEAASASESEVDVRGLTLSDRRQQEVQQQSGPRIAPENFDFSLLPRDAEGRPTSIGSMAHGFGQCEVCVFFVSPEGCQNGIYCSFCHLPHKSGRRKNQMRPCKGKRDRYRKLLDRLAQQVEDDPDGFCVDNVELPPSISTNEKSKAKLAARLELLAEQVKANRAASSTGASSSHLPMPAAACGSQPMAAPAQWYPGTSSQAAAGRSSIRSKDIASIVSL